MSVLFNLNEDSGTNGCRLADPSATMTFVAGGALKPIVSCHPVEGRDNIDALNRVGTSWLMLLRHGFSCVKVCFHMII